MFDLSITGRRKRDTGCFQSRTLAGIGGSGRVERSRFPRSPEVSPNWWTSKRLRELFILPGVCALDRQGEPCRLRQGGGSFRLPPVDNSWEGDRSRPGEQMISKIDS